MLRIGINGFGRIGRLVTRIIEEEEGLEVVAINSRAKADSHAHLLAYDSCYGIWDKQVESRGSIMTIDGREVITSQANSPAEIPRAKRNIDCVIDATGKFKTHKELSGHRDAASVKKVIFTAPGKDLDATIVLGVNEHIYDRQRHHIVSNASCTTNGAAPVIKLINDTYGVASCLFTTIHAVTHSQNILDNSHKKNLRLTRSCYESMIPTTTGASKALGIVIPEIKGKVQGMAMRVPTPVVSYIDMVIQLNKETTVEEVTELFLAKQSNILGVSTKELVSVDFTGDNHSAIVDLPLIQVQNGKLLKLGVWYDNEWGYARRVVDLTKYIM